MTITLTIGPKMTQAIWLHKIQEFIKALREEKYKMVATK